MRAEVIVLGSSGAVQTAYRDNTALAFRMDDSAVLLDCPGSVFLKLRRAGVDPLRLAAVVITHAHPDHIYGLPSLVHHLWMLGRSERMPVFAPEAELPRLARLLELFDLSRRAGFLEPRPLTARASPLTGDGSSPFWEHAGHRLFALPVDHGPPAFAIRWDLPGGGRVVYSSDTRPVEALAEFGRGAALFIHEATFSEAEASRAEEGGHTTAAQAGRLAARAEARRLLLVHLDHGADPARWVEEARRQFAGPVEVPDDGAVYPVV